MWPSTLQSCRNLRAKLACIDRTMDMGLVPPDHDRKTGEIKSKCRRGWLQTVGRSPYAVVEHDNDEIRGPQSPHGREDGGSREKGSFAFDRQDGLLRAGQRDAERHR